MWALDFQIKRLRESENGVKKANSSGDNWIWTYYQGIKNGTFIVGRYIRMIYEYLVSGLQEKRFFYDGNKANAAINWIEEHCFHVEGDLAPGNLLLEVWQKAFLSAVFGIVDDEGHRVFREILLLVARKNGKSIVASSVGNYIFRSSVGGYGARVFCIAPKLDQADIIYNGIWSMITLDPEWQELKEKTEEKDVHKKKINDDSMLARHRMSDLAVPGTNSTVKKIAFSS